MEPISYLRAPIRRWPVLIPFVLVAMVVAYLIPVNAPKSTFPSPTFLATAQVGLSPHGKGNTLGAKLSLNQLVYYAHVPAVIDAAATAQGVKVTPKLQNDVIVAKAKKDKQANAAAKAGGAGKAKSANFLEVGVLQRNKAQSVSMSNAFASALGSYAQLQFDAQQKQKISTQEAYITNLQNAIAALPTKTTTPTTIKPGTTKKGKIKRTVIRPPVTTTTAKALGPPNQPAQLTAFRAAPATPTTADPDLSPRYPRRDPGTPTPLGVTTTTAPKISKTDKLEKNVLTKELVQATAHLQALESQPTPQSGYKIINPAKRAKKLNSKPSTLLDRHSVRLGIGFLVGLILGILATWLLDGLDRRLRTTKRAEEVFRLPVVAEIPASTSKTVSTIPVVDIVVDPYSPISEAYRKLYVAILTAPPVTWVKRGGAGIETPELIQARPLVASPVGATTAGTPDAGPVGEGRYPVAVGTTDLVSPRRHRFAILDRIPHRRTLTLARRGQPGDGVRRGRRPRTRGDDGRHEDGVRGRGKGLPRVGGRDARHRPGRAGGECPALPDPRRVEPRIGFGVLESGAPCAQGGKSHRGGPRRRRRAPDRSTSPLDPGWSRAPARGRPGCSGVRELADDRPGRRENAEAAHATASTRARRGDDEHGEGPAFEVVEVTHSRRGRKSGSGAGA